MAKEVLIGSLGLGIVMLAVFIGISLRSLGYNEVGLNYSGYFKSIENKTYTSGFHFLGLGHSFIPYYLNLQNIEFSMETDATLPPIDCRTRDGLALKLEVSFQYKVEPDEIYTTYTTFGDKLKVILLRKAIDAISLVATYYESADFFHNKRKIIHDMEDTLNKTLS